MSTDKRDTLPEKLYVSFVDSPIRTTSGRVFFANTVEDRGSTPYVPEASLAALREKLRIAEDGFLNATDALEARCEKLENELRLAAAREFDLRNPGMVWMTSDIAEEKKDV